MGANLAGGAWVEVIAQKEIFASPGTYGDENKFAYATNVDYDEDFNVQPLEVLGHLGPLEYNSHGYSCTVNIGFLVTKSKTDFNKFVPNRADVQADGQLPNWLITLRSTASEKTTYAQFKGVVVASAGQQIQSNQFATMNTRWFATERIKDASEGLI